MLTVQTSSGRQFGAAGDEALLDAALRAGVTLAYSCRTGRCGTCKGRVRHGDSVALHDELGLTPLEQADGWVLTCVRSATSDLELDIDDLGEVALFPERTLPCRIQSLEALSADVVKAVLRLPPQSDFDFHPGQYIDVIGHGGVRRSYSIANAPSPARQLELHIRRVPNGALSAYWFGSAKVGDLLRLRGPLGTFFLRDVDGRDLVFLATGTGIAPVKAMLEGLAGDAAGPTARPRSISVYWGGRVPDDLYWNIASAGPNNRFVPVLSRAGIHWQGARGHVQQAVLAQGHDWQRTSVYACGSDAMIRGARAQLATAGMNPRRFHSDAFVCSAAA